jgi:predicted dehydrogenase
MSEPIRIAVLGAGLIGRKHIDRIGAHAGFELAGIADINADATRKAYAGVPVEADFSTLFDKVKPEAALIASPNQLHTEHGLECARRGIPFILEKPVTDTVESAAELCAAVKAAGVPTLVGHHRRHHPPVAEARRLVREGAIGDVVGVSAIWATCKPEDYFAAGPWRREKGGGPILINLIHEVDFLRFCLGEIASVSAITSNRQRGFAVEDTAALVLAFASGALGTFLLSDAAVSPWTMEQGLGESAEFPFSGESGHRFVGSLGSLEFPGLRLWRQAGETGHWNEPVLSRTLFAGRLDPYVAQLTHFRDIVRDGAASLQSVEDGARTLLATSAVSEAAASGSTIDIAGRYAGFGWTRQ